MVKITKMGVWGRQVKLKNDLYIYDYCLLYILYVFIDMFGIIYIFGFYLSNNF